MNTKGYTEEELKALVDWTKQDWLKKHTITTKKNNAKKITAVDTILVTDFDKDIELKVEVKIEEPKYFETTGNVTFDALSSFKFKDESKKAYTWFQYDDLCKLIDIRKKGTFFDTEPDIILKRCKGKDVFIAYDNHILTSKEFQDYVIKKYRVKVNPKKDYGLDDTWESAFFCVPKDDKELQKAIIRTEEDLERIYSTKKISTISPLTTKVVEDDEEFVARPFNPNFTCFYHKKDGCSYAKKSNNTIIFKTRKEAEDKGYKKCTYCKF